MAAADKTRTRVSATVSRTMFCCIVKKDLGLGPLAHKQLIYKVSEGRIQAAL